MQKRTALFILILLLIGISSTLAFTQPSLHSIDENVRLSNSLPSTTFTPSPTLEEDVPSGPPLSLTLSLLCFCLTFSLVIGVFVLGFILRMPSREDKELARKKDEHGL